MALPALRPERPVSLWTRIVALISLLLVTGTAITGSLSLFLLNRTLIQSVDNDLRAGMSEMLTLAQLELAGSTIDELWASLCSQTILGTPEVENLDARIIRHTEIARLESEVDKLTRDHQRVKNPAQRNEIYAKLHKAKAQLAKLREA